jgi:hypothetical protein
MVFVAIRNVGGGGWAPVDGSAVKDRNTTRRICVFLNFLRIVSDILCGSS